MSYFILGFAVACLWGWICYRAGKCSAENAYFKQQEREYEQVEQVFAHTADLSRDELLERVRGNSQK